MSFTVFDNPTQTVAPKFQTTRKGMLVNIPFDPMIPLNKGYNQIKLYQEFQTIYEEVKEGLVWLDGSPIYENERPSFTTEKGNSFYRRVVKYEDLRGV